MRVISSLMAYWLKEFFIDSLFIDILSQQLSIFLLVILTRLESFLLIDSVNFLSQFALS